MFNLDMNMKITDLRLQLHFPGVNESDKNKGMWNVPFPWYNISIIYNEVIWVIGN